MLSRRTLPSAPKSCLDQPRRQDAQPLSGRGRAVLAGRVGASRPRVNVQPYDTDGDGVYDSAWVIMGDEESKALGEGCDRRWMSSPTISARTCGTTPSTCSTPSRGAGRHAQPAGRGSGERGCSTRCWRTSLGNEFYETEIARRFSHFSQPIHQIGDSGVSAVADRQAGHHQPGWPGRHLPAHDPGAR